MNELSIDDQSEARRPEMQRLRYTMFRLMDSLSVPPEPGSLLDLPLLQMKCLHIIYFHEGLKLVDVARMMNAGLPGISRTVERLVKRGMIERIIAPEDHRARQLRLTPEARDAMQEHRSKRDAHLEWCTRRMSQEELETVIHAMETLAAAAEKVTGRTPPPFVPEVSSTQSSSVVGMSSRG